MSDQSSPKEDYIAALGEGFGKAFHEVWKEWMGAWIRHEELKEVFGSQEGIDYLNSVAPQFFADVQQLFWNDLMLYVSRLTDRSKAALRLRSLEDFLKDDPDLRKQVGMHRKAAAKAAIPARDWRNRRIAHIDRRLAIGDPSAKPLPPVQMETCKAVLDHVHRALEAIQYSRMDSGIANLVIYDPRGGGLVAYLKGLVDSVRFIAEIINPGDPYSLDLEKGREFLRKLGRSDPSDANRVFELMSMAHWTWPHR
ncbi:MAG: hypothetical protein F4Y07_05165 [Gemmatimonadetes bacterium]|nr:hypothetical protein [Gemmatimonadota bacterium]